MFSLLIFLCKIPNYFVFFLNKMSFYPFEEDNSSAFNDFNDTREVDPLASGISSAATDVSNESSSKKRSFIWKYCEDMRPDGWKCTVVKDNGERCGLFFPYSVTKGSTSNTITHLLKEHGIVNPNVAKKVFIILFVQNF